MLLETEIQTKKQIVLDDLATRVKNLPDDEDFEDFLEDNFGIQVQDNGLISVWFLGKAERDIIGVNAILLFHHTASGALAGIVKDGLVPGRHVVNLQAPVTKASGVYLTLRDSGPDVDGYARGAAAYHGGDCVALEVRCLVKDLMPDPDDADLSSGRYQYVLPYVRCEDIVNLGEVVKDYPCLQKAGAPCIKRGEIGMKLSSGQVVTTATGRQTAPFPKIDTSSERKTVNTLKRVDLWLMNNAVAEAEARGDKWNARMFRGNRDNPHQADKDSAELYLFG